MTSLFFAIALAALGVAGIIKTVLSKRGGAMSKLCIISLCLLFLALASSLFVNYQNPA